MQKKNYDAIDLMKWICACLVMYIHFSPVLTFAPKIDLFISRGLTKIAVPFFFAVSGFFLIQKIERVQQNAKKRRKTLRDFCIRILLLYTIWFAVNIVYTTIYDLINNEPLMNWRIYWKGYWFTGIQAHLWYLMSTVYAAPLVYLLWKGGRQAVIAGCVVGNLLQCLDQPYRLGVIFSSPMVNTWRSEYGLLYSAFIHAVPMMCLGALCLADNEKKSNQQWVRNLVIVAAVHMVELVALCCWQGTNLRADRFLTSSLLIYCLVNWLVTLDFRFPIKWLGEAFRLSSTWMYCAHMLMLALYHWIFAYHGTIRYLAVGGLSVISSIPYVTVKLLIKKKKTQIATVRYSNE